jgi:hypothetical protein
LEAGDTEGIQRLIEYFLRCPFSQARMIDVTEEGKVLYKTAANRLGRFSEAASEDLLAGPKRNFQVFDPLDFLAEVTQHIPDPGEHLIRYYGWYSNKGSVAESVGKKKAKQGRKPEDFDRRAARAKAQKPPLCSFYFAGESRGFAGTSKKRKVVGYC